jgi:YYY domain-containing protein
MLDFILWYLLISLVGITIFPLSYRLLPGLPDRGYAFSRALGLLSWGYIFWLLTSLQILRNNPGGLLLAFGIVLSLSYWAARGISRQELLAWWRERKKLVIGVEVLFLLAFAAWAFVRSANPEIQYTEKPMELAFINAILHSLEFPPHDPWLSGYAISYYYFGYVLVAMAAKITAVPGSIAFNLGIALVFALSAIGAYGLVYDLLEVWRSKRQPNDVAQREGLSPDAHHHWILAFLGPLYVLIASNLEGFLDVLHARGLFWKVDPSGQLTSAFWKWLDMKELSQPPVQPLSWMPARSWWWWRASRVLQDYDLAGNWREVIDEFPFFSYLLADLHPHVLAMPFALVAIALALNVFLGGGQGRFRLFNFRLDIGPQFLALAGVVLGGLAFLNTWDFPIFVALYSGAYILLRSHQRGWGWYLLGDFFLLSFVLGIIGVLLYLPFYLGFSSQAGGILPNLIYVTRGAHLWVMFGPFFFLLFAYLFYLWRLTGDRKRLGKGLFLAVGAVLILFAASLLMGFGITRLPVLGDLFLGSIGAIGPVGELFQQAFIRRLINSGGWVTLVVLLALSLGLLWPKLEAGHRRIEGDSVDPMDDSPGVRRLTSTQYSPALPHIFVVLLILVGTLLVLGPEFFFLRDQFGYRINTIFKFYYQAWILWGVASAFGTAVLLYELRGLKGMLFGAGMVVVLGASLVYPVLSLSTKTNGFDPPQGFTLDGTAYFEQQSPDEMAGIRWLSSAPPGVVAEAVGGSYTEYARIATQSGQPTVLGWPGHESQWRGGAVEMGSRQSDIERLYRTSDWNDAQEILRQYNIRYVYIGSLERSTYVVNETKFKRFLTPVFQQGQVTIYEVPLTMMASSP